MSSTINTKPIDRFRQGIYADKSFLIERNTGLPVINSSLGSSVVEMNVFGQTKTYSDNTTFVEQEKFDVLKYINDVDYKLVFPAIIGNVNLRDANQLNGVIEPLSIRPAASLMSVNYPHEPNRFYGTLESGEEDFNNRSSMITIYYSKKETTEIPFLEMNDAFIERDTFYMSDKVAKIQPFDDLQQDRVKTKFLNVEYTGDIIEAIKAMNPSNDNIIKENDVIYSTGYNFEGTVCGLDSIAFGGLGN